MRQVLPSLESLPPPPEGRSGWPWTQAHCPRAASDAGGAPRITIVTPSFNQAQFLEETIRSVLLQGYPNLQYMIIDGGSRDGSVEIIRRYERWIDDCERAGSRTGTRDQQACSAPASVGRLAELR